MKNAVVTGGGSGIGRAIANRLRADGHHVVILDLNPSDDEFAFTAAVTDRAAVDDTLNSVVTEHAQCFSQADLSYAQTLLAGGW